jgi:hypothetical protein
MMCVNNGSRRLLIVCSGAAFLLRPRCLGVAVTAVVLVLTVSGCASSLRTPGALTSSAPAAASHQRHPRVAGPITAQHGSTWMVKSIDGTMYTVLITDATKFGTKKDSATKDYFRVGDVAHIAGTMSGTTITASRVSSPSDPLG